MERTKRSIAELRAYTEKRVLRTLENKANFTVAHVQFCHPWINLGLLLTVLSLACVSVLFQSLRAPRLPLALLVFVASGFGAPVRVPVSSQHRAAAVVVRARVHGRAIGDHVYVGSGLERSFRAATQASFHLVPMNRGRWDGTSEQPAHINTLIAAGRAPMRHIETKHSIRSCFDSLREIGAVNVRAHSELFKAAGCVLRVSSLLFIISFTF